MRDYYRLAAIGAFHLRQDVNVVPRRYVFAKTNALTRICVFLFVSASAFQSTEIHLPRHFIETRIAKGFMPEEFRLTGSSLFPTHTLYNKLCGE